MVNSDKSQPWSGDLEFLREVADDDELALSALARLDGWLADLNAMRTKATSVVGFWDSLDAVSGADERPTETFAAEMGRRVDALRDSISGTQPAGRRPSVRAWAELTDQEKTERLAARPKFEEDMHPSGSSEGKT